MTESKAIGKAQDFLLSMLINVRVTKYGTDTDVHYFLL